MSDTVAQLKQLIHDQLGVDPDLIEIDKPISGYGLDSLAIVELIFNIEEHFNIDFPAALPEINTLSNLARLVDDMRPAAA